jgi:hypothetical protein
MMWEGEQGEEEAGVLFYPLAQDVKEEEQSTFIYPNPFFLHNS